MLNWHRASDCLKSFLITDDRNVPKLMPLSWHSFGARHLRALQWTLLECVFAWVYGIIITTGNNQSVCLIDFSIRIKEAVMNAALKWPVSQDFAGPGNDPSKVCHLTERVVNTRTTPQACLCFIVFFFSCPSPLTYPLSLLLCQGLTTRSPGWPWSHDPLASAFDIRGL